MTPEIQVLETDKQYLVKIPPAQRERAKAIRPREWDPKRVAWVYPKTPEIKRELIREFSKAAHIQIRGFEDETAITASTQTPKDIAALQRKIESLEAKLEKDRRTHEARLDAAKKAADRAKKRNAKTRDELREKKAELAETEKALEKVRSEADATARSAAEATKKEEVKEIRKSHTREIEALNTENAGLRRALADLKVKNEKLHVQLSDAETSPESQRRFLQQALAFSRVWAANNSSFSRMLEESEATQIDQSLAIYIHDTLSHRLAKILDVLATSDSLSPLTHEAEKLGLIDRSVKSYLLSIATSRIDLSHQIQRRIDRASVNARCLVTLCSAAIVWPQLKKR